MDLKRSWGLLALILAAAVAVMAVTGDWPVTSSTTAQASTAGPDARVVFKVGEFGELLAPVPIDIGGARARVMARVYTHDDLFQLTAQEVKAWNDRNPTRKITATKFRIEDRQPVVGENLAVITTYYLAPLE